MYGARASSSRSCVTFIGTPVEAISPRGLVERPEDWLWSSFRHYASGEVGVVEIESQWTARMRERAGIFPTLKARASTEKPRPRPALSEVERAKLGRGTLESKS